MKYKHITFLLMALLPLLTAQSTSKLSTHSKLWGKTEGKEVRLYTLTNAKGMVVEVTNNDNELKILYEAQTDKPTILNQTHHNYFNLAANKENILNHQLTIFAEILLQQILHGFQQAK